MSKRFSVFFQPPRFYLRAGCAIGLLPLAAKLLPVELEFEFCIGLAVLFEFGELTDGTETEPLFGGFGGLFLLLPASTLTLKILAITPRALGIINTRNTNSEVTKTRQLEKILVKILFINFSIPSRSFRFAPLPARLKR